MLSDAEYEKLLGYGTQNTGLNRNMQRQLEQAKLLRSKELEGQMVSGHYVAPSIIDRAAEAYRGYRGGQMEQQAMQTGGQMDTNTAAQNALILQGIKNGRKPPANPAMMGQAPANPYDDGSGVYQGEE